MKQVAYAARAEDGKWAIYDDRGNALDPAKVRFNQETGEFESEPLAEQDEVRDKVKGEYPYQLKT